MQLNRHKLQGKIGLFKKQNFLNIFSAIGNSLEISKVLNFEMFRSAPDLMRGGQE